MSEEIETNTFNEDAPEEMETSIDMGAPRVRLKWYTPRGDQLLAHMARVSNTKATEDDPADKLIGYLLRNHHWSPFEMVNLCVEVHTERDISAQILRHWSLKFQEFSTRYAEVEELRWSTECRFQDAKNRQNSYTVEEVAFSGVKLPIDAEVVENRDEQIDVEQVVSYFDAVVNETRTRSMEAYQQLLKYGVAKECARRILPIGLMPTVMYINGNLRSWITYCMERTKPGVQKEHREIALAIEPVIASCFPLVWKAVEKYRADQGQNQWKLNTFEDIQRTLEKAGFNGNPASEVERLIHSGK